MVYREVSFEDYAGSHAVIHGVRQATTHLESVDWWVAPNTSTTDGGFEVRDLNPQSQASAESTRSPAPFGGSIGANDKLERLQRT